MFCGERYQIRANLPLRRRTCRQNRQFQELWAPVIRHAGSGFWGWAVVKRVAGTFEATFCCHVVVLLVTVRFPFAVTLLQNSCGRQRCPLDPSLGGVPAGIIDYRPRVFLAGVKCRHEKWGDSSNIACGPNPLIRTEGSGEGGIGSQRGCISNGGIQIPNGVDLNPFRKLQARRPARILFSHFQRPTLKRSSHFNNTRKRKMSSQCFATRE